MSDTSASTASAVDRVKKISLATFGGGRKPSPAEQAAGGATIGTIKGRATGVRSVESLDPKTGELTTFESIVGRFRAVPADPKLPTMEAGTLYLPGGFHDDMMDALSPRDAASGVRKPNGNQITFEFDVRCIEAPNKAGYSYVIVPVLEEATNEQEDIFAAIDAKSMARRKALSAPTKAKADASKGDAKADASKGDAKAA